MDTALLTTLRALKRSAPALLTMLALRRPVGVMELVRILEINPRTAEGMLQSLADLKIAERQSYHGGFVLTQTALNTLYILQLSRKVEEDSINLITDTTTTSRTLHNMQCVQSDRYPVTVAAILEHSDKIFPSKVVASGLELNRLHPDIVLAWMAQVYVGMRNFTTPAAIVYKRLKEGATPGAEYVEDPLRYLPVKFLAAVGLPLPPDEMTSNGWTAEDVEEPGTQETGTAPVLDNPEGARLAWEEIKAQAATSDSVPRVALETWLFGTEGVGYQDGTLTVKVRNPYTRDWILKNLPEHSQNIVFI